MGCTHNCNQGRRCACAVFHDPDFDAEDFGCDSTLARVAQAIVGAAVLACAGLAIVAALAN